MSDSDRSGPTLTDSARPARYFVRFEKTVGRTYLMPPSTHAIERELPTPASLADVLQQARLLLPPLPIGGLLSADEVGLVLELAAAIGQASEIARREGVRVELYQRFDVREVTGPRDGARTWNWRQQLRAVEVPP